MYHCPQIDFGDSNEIDFGAIDAPAAEIDFGDGDAGGEIDWGNIDVASPENIVSKFCMVVL